MASCLTKMVIQKSAHTEAKDQLSKNLAEMKKKAMSLNFFKLLSLNSLSYPLTCKSLKYLTTCGRFTLEQQLSGFTLKAFRRFKN